MDYIFSKINVDILQDIGQRKWTSYTCVGALRVLKTFCTLQDSVRCHVTSSLLQMFSPFVQRHVSMVTVSWGRVLMVTPLYSRPEIFVRKQAASVTAL